MTAMWRLASRNYKEKISKTYSIILGRNSKKSAVDVDLSSLGGGMNISRHHARIFYDFQRRRFALEVLGKNGCFVEGVLHLPGLQPVKLDSQDLLQIGDKKFYFLLPVRSILGVSIGARNHVNNYQAGSVPQPQNLGLPPPSGGGRMGYRMKERGCDEYYEECSEEEDEEEGEEEEEEEEDGGGEGDSSTGNGMRGDGAGGSGYRYAAGRSDKKADARSRVDREADDQQLLLLEEKDVVSSVAMVLSDLCGPGEWMPMRTCMLSWWNNSAISGITVV